MFTGQNFAHQYLIFARAFLAWPLFVGGVDCVVDILCTVDGRVLVGAVHARDGDIRIWMCPEHERMANFQKVRFIRYHHTMRL